MISFFHIASVYPKATEVMIENVRKHHPDSYYFLAVDGTDKDYNAVASKYNCDLEVYSDIIGGPISPHGYNLEKTLKFLERFKTACERCDTSHIIMMEDDVLILKPITVNPRWDHVGADTKVGNILPNFVLDLIQSHSGSRPNPFQYGAGGGTIFNKNVFLVNYSKNIEWFKKHFESIQEYYPTIGYIDCFMNVYYWLCGKRYESNPHRTDTHNHQQGFDYESFISNLPQEIEIINNYKKYYWTNDE
jgi:hypothetical protein